MVFGEEVVTKRAGSSSEGRTLQRPPPLMRIFLPPSWVRSSRRTLRLPFRASPPPGPPAAKIAAMNPAAPAPITMTGSFIWLILVGFPGFLKPRGREYGLGRLHEGCERGRAQDLPPGPAREGVGGPRRRQRGRGGDIRGAETRQPGEAAGRVKQKAAVQGRADDLPRGRSPELGVD